MAPPKSKLPLTAQPKLSNHFDAWNSSSTGHQRAENRLGGSTGWRQSRATKLSYQFKSGGTGGKRISDAVGAGSKDWHEATKAIITEEEKSRAMVNFKDMLMGKRNGTSTFYGSLKLGVRHGMDGSTDRSSQQCLVPRKD